MDKSPISILMEFLVSKKLPPPVFVDLAKTGEDHKPVFRMKVSAGGHESEGEGFTKQEAKKKACGTLLDLLKVGDGLRNVKIVGPSLNNKLQAVKPVIAQDLKQPEVVSNSIGDLIQLCQRYRLSEPVYNLVGMEGPDHIKKFTMECSLLNMTEYGQGGSVKIAKKIAAFKILQKLEDAIKNNKTTNRNTPVIDLSLSADKAIKRYEQIKDPYKGTENVNFKDLHTVYEDIPEKSQTLLKFINNRIPDEEPVVLIMKIADELTVKLTVRDMNRSVLKKQLNLAVFLMQLGTTPPLSSLGLDEKEAAVKLLDTLVVMCT